MRRSMASDLDANGTEITTNNVAYSSDGLAVRDLTQQAGICMYDVYPGKKCK